MARAMPLMLAVCAAAIVLLGIRVLQLESQLERAERRLGGDASGRPPTTETAEATLEPRKPVGLEPRVTAVEQEVRALRDDLRTLEKATEATLAMPAPGANPDPRQILSVVKGETDRIRDRQLDFARSRWSEGRKQALEQFTALHDLQPEQKAQIEELLENESNRLVAIMRKPDVLENPEQMAADWSAVMRDTDRAATGVLDPQQVAPWKVARTIERRVLWPWLPLE
jgi:hypothetical protein